MIAIAAAAPEDGPDVAVDRLHRPEGDLLVAVVEDAVEMPDEQEPELLEGGQALPAQGQEPVGEEAVRRALVGVAPELRELLLEQVGLGQAVVEREEVAQGLAFLPVQMRPASARASLGK